MNRKKRDVNYFRIYDQDLYLVHKSKTYHFRFYDNLYQCYMNEIPDNWTFDSADSFIKNEYKKTKRFFERIFRKLDRHFW